MPPEKEKSLSFPSWRLLLLSHTRHCCYSSTLSVLVFVWYHFRSFPFLSCCGKSLYSSGCQFRSACSREYSIMLYNRRPKHRPVVPERPTQDKYDRFEEWLRQNGAQFDCVSAQLDADLYKMAVSSELTFVFHLFCFYLFYFVSISVCIFSSN
jgi:hypothetical protein